MALKEVGFVGLGKMGENMVSRILDNSNLKVIAWNRSPEPLKRVSKKGAEKSTDMKDLVSQMSGRKVVWLMLPAGKVTEQYFQELLELSEKNDIIIDGGNANFHDSVRRHKEASEKGVMMLDVGVSGGVVAAERGYAMMAGGSKDTYEYCLPLFKAMCMPSGFGLVGEEPGSGHYVKMIHNAIEYGMMQSISEGFDLLKNGRYDKLNLLTTAGIWNHGTIISSFLMEMAENALKNNSPDLKGLEPWVDDSGEGEWSASEALAMKVPFVSNAYALHARRLSRQKGDYAFKLLAAIRNEFGGHEVKKKGKK